MRIFCGGIGGIGLSAYAAFQAANGHRVVGSDRSDSLLVKNLRSQGIAVSLIQDGAAMTEDTDLYVYSEAIPKDNPERMRAQELGIRSISYFQALGELTKDSFLIAVSGTHGKSSTTAMAAVSLLASGKDPSVIIGTKMTELRGRNWRKGSPNIFIAEACEYRKSFHHLSPDIVLLTNADGDHFDAYKDQADYENAFIDFLKKLPEDGCVITHGNDEQCRRIVEASGKQILDADTFSTPLLSVPGEHMKLNAQLVLALADFLQLDQDKVRNALADFRGTWRRMEEKGEMESGAIVVDDYAHHPLEIKATLAAMKEKYRNRRIVCIFQPHTHDRTKRLYNEFIASFMDADIVIIPDIYNARSDIEHGELNVSAFIKDIRQGSAVEAFGGDGLVAAKKWVKEHATPEDLVIVMGAGNIAGLADELTAHGS